MEDVEETESIDTSENKRNPSVELIYSKYFHLPSWGYWKGEFQSYVSKMFAQVDRRMSYCVLIVFVCVINHL